jgi:hypothetical protein
VLVLYCLEVDGLAPRLCEDLQVPAALDVVRFRNSRGPIHADTVPAARPEVVTILEARPSSRCASWLVGCLDN